MPLDEIVIDGAFPDLILFGDNLFFKIIEELLFDNIAENLFYPREYTS